MERIRRLFDALRTVLDNRMLAHRVVDPEHPTEHAADCAACELRAAFDDLDPRRKQARD